MVVVCLFPLSLKSFHSSCGGAVTSSFSCKEKSPKKESTLRDAPVWLTQTRKACADGIYVFVEEARRL